MSEDYPVQTELFAFDHTPIRPVRPGTHGEGIYLDLWREFVAGEPEAAAAIFRELPSQQLDQRGASVAASFMTYMGCNGGAGFTHNAKHIAGKRFFTDTERAFVAAWALDNQRNGAFNSGLRSIEFILAETHPIVDGRVSWDRVPTVTADDMDVIECMVKWWSTPRATFMRTKAEGLIEKARQASEAARRVLVRLKA